MIDPIVGPERVAACRRAVLALGLLLVQPFSASALDRTTIISQYAADRWGTKEGLPQASVNAIAQTTDGYIWLATEEGLVRFDGVRFTVFDTSNSGLAESHVTSLRAARDGALWIRTGEALYRYAAGLIRLACSSRSIGLSASPILEDRSGAVWSRAAGGLTVYTAWGECRHHAFDASSPDASVTALIENGDGSLLIGTSVGLKRFAGGAIAAPLDQAVPVIAFGSIGAIGAIGALHRDREGPCGLGHRVTVVENGQQAADRVAADTFDLVLMDVQMPVMDGLESTTVIRDRERASGAHLPIVAVSAHVMSGDKERFLRAGMDAYISKPIGLTDIVDVIRLVVATPPADPVTSRS